MEKKQNNQRPKPVVLCVLDGWGIAPPHAGNAIANAKLPHFNELVSSYPVMALSAAGEAVGVPWGDMGNSKVGHLSLGSGRIIYQDLPRINKAISDGSFFVNEALLAAAAHVKKNNSRLHLMGLLSNGGVHAAVEHLTALLAFASEQKLSKVYEHLFLDGRDMAFNSARQLITEAQRAIVDYKIGVIATLVGRFYAMDRNNNWERTARAYYAMVEGKADKTFATPDEAFAYYYNNKVYDEEFPPAVISVDGKAAGTIAENDAVIYFNFRADRARQMTKALTVPGLSKFSGARSFHNLFFVTMTEYEKSLPVSVVFPPVAVSNTLGDVLAAAGLKQLRIAETEKYAHVTYFFNGGREDAGVREKRIVIPSPGIASYADEPKMSASKITERLKKEILAGAYDFILVNYANADMVGHTGDMDATISALEYLDSALHELSQLILSQGGVLLITADHGNAEELFNMQTGAIDKEHSANPVPFIIVGKQFEGKRLDQADVSDADLSILNPHGILADVAPTILDIMQLQKPPEMTGRSLL